MLHIINDLALAGAEMTLYKLLAASSRERFAHAVISLMDGGELRNDIEALGTPVYSLGIRGPFPGPGSVLRLLRLVRQIDPQLIHGWMYHGNLAAQVAGVFAGRQTRVLWSIHQSLHSFEHEKRLTAAVIKLCARISTLPDQITYVSNASAAQHEAVGYRREKRLVLSYGFDTDTFAPSIEAYRSVRSELGLAEDALLIGLVGRYHPVKDHGNFLNAAARLLQTHPEARFILCGKGVDRNNTSLCELVQQRQLNGRVHLLGERRDIARITAALDIAASSSSSEGFPNVIGEAMSAGVPCVATDVSDVPEIVASTGRVVPPRDAEALAAALAELIELGSEGRKVLGSEARARVIERYSLGSAVARYELVYERLIA